MRPHPAARDSLEKPTTNSEEKIMVNGQKAACRCSEPLTTQDSANPDICKACNGRIAEERAQETHKWNNDECSCGSDTVICQGCGRAVCGEVAVWTPITMTADAPPFVRSGNVGPCCFAKFGLGHSGGGVRGAKTNREVNQLAAQQDFHA
jgi:hypothetical protein